MDALDTFAVGFGGFFVAVATHITFNSLYGCLVGSPTVISRARVAIGFIFLATALANFAQNFPLNYLGCLFTAKLSIITFHLQMIGGEAFQMYRISVIIKNKGNRAFLCIGLVLILLRSAAMVSDVVLSTSRPGETPGKLQCQFEQEYYSGIVHLAFDAGIELFITTAISMALFHHTQEIKWLHRGSSGADLYRIIIETNIFRTILLFLINIFTIVIIVLDPDSILLSYMWSLMGIVYLYFVIYDKGMVRFLHQLAKVPVALRLPPSIPQAVSIDEWANQYFSQSDSSASSLQPPSMSIV